MKETSLYIHIPYCRSKCIYCDFYSGGERIAQWPRLLDALCCEMQLRKNELSVLPSSIYIGGRHAVVNARGDSEIFGWKN